MGSTETCGHPHSEKIVSNSSLCSEFHLLQPVSLPLVLQLYILEVRKAPSLPSDDVVVDSDKLHHEFCS